MRVVMEAFEAIFRPPPPHYTKIPKLKFFLKNKQAIVDRTFITARVVSINLKTK